MSSPDIIGLFSNSRSVKSRKKISTTLPPIVHNIQFFISFLYLDVCFYSDPSGSSLLIKRMLLPDTSLNVFSRLWHAPGLMGHRTHSSSVSWIRNYLFRIRFWFRIRPWKSFGGSRPYLALFSNKKFCSKSCLFNVGRSIVARKVVILIFFDFLLTKLILCLWELLSSHFVWSGSGRTSGSDRIHKNTL